MFICYPRKSTQYSNIIDPICIATHAATTLLKECYNKFMCKLYNQITCHEVLSSRGYPTVQIDVYCTIKGLSKVLYIVVHYFIFVY